MSHFAKAIRVAFFHAFQPLFVAAVFAAWWFMPGRESAPLITAMVLLLVANLVVYALETAIPDIDSWNSTASDRKRDVFFVATRVALWGPILQILALVAVLPLIDAVSLPSIWPSDWPIAARILLALSIAEVVAYGIHFAFHRSPRLWRFHATHHAQNKLNSARWSALHPVEIALVQVPIFAVAALLGPADIDVAGAIVVGRCVTVVAHSNLRLSASGFGWIFTTPEPHRLHHHRGKAMNANYADVFILFDRIARTFSDKRTQQVGLGSGRDLTLREQLLLPYNLDSLRSNDNERVGFIIDVRDSAQAGNRSAKPTQ